MTAANGSMRHASRPREGEGEGEGACVDADPAAHRRPDGLGVIALGVACLASADFVAAQPLPKGFAHREALAFAMAALLIVAGAAVEWRRTVSSAAAVLALFYAIVVVWMDVPAVAANPACARASPRSC